MRSHSIIISRHTPLMPLSLSLKHTPTHTHAHSFSNLSVLDLNANFSHASHFHVFARFYYYRIKSLSCLGVMRKSAFDCGIRAQACFRALHCSASLIYLVIDATFLTKCSMEHGKLSFELQYAKSDNSFCSTENFLQTDYYRRQIS